MCGSLCIVVVFFFNDTATTEIYTLSLHDALPICLTKIAGSHSMKFGTSPEHWSAMKGKNASNFAGSMNFSQTSVNPLDTGYAYSNALLGVLNPVRQIAV